VAYCLDAGECYCFGVLLLEGVCEWTGMRIEDGCEAVDCYKDRGCVTTIVSQGDCREGYDLLYSLLNFYS